MHKFGKKNKNPQRCFPGDNSRLIYFADDAFIAGEPPNIFLNRRMLMPYISKPTPPRRRGVSAEFPPGLALTQHLRIYRQCIKSVNGPVNAG